MDIDFDFNDDIISTNDEYKPKNDIRINDANLIVNNINNDDNNITNNNEINKINNDRINNNNRNDDNILKIYKDNNKNKQINDCFNIDDDNKYNNINNNFISTKNDSVQAIQIQAIQKHDNKNILNNIDIEALKYKKENNNDLIVNFSNIKLSKNINNADGLINYYGNYTNTNCNKIFHLFEINQVFPSMIGDHKGNDLYFTVSLQNEIQFLTLNNNSKEIIENILTTDIDISWATNGYLIDNETTLKKANIKIASILNVFVSKQQDFINFYVIVLAYRKNKYNSFIISYFDINLEKKKIKYNVTIDTIRKLLSFTIANNLIKYISLSKNVNNNNNKFNIPTKKF